jgi:hypothetical protein
MLDISSCLLLSESSEIDRREWQVILRLQREHARPEVQPCGETKTSEPRTAYYKHSDTYARPLRSLISSSQASVSHQGITEIHLASKVGTKSSHFVISFIRDSYTSLARLNISSCMVSNSLDTVVPISVKDTGFLTPVSRRTVSVCFLAMSLGPISRRSGTPL